nr:immunoglobulin light chain junction region [Macaca mulatta]
CCSYRSRTTYIF